MKSSLHNNPAEPAWNEYTPDQRHRETLLKGWQRTTGNLFRARSLIWQLFKRDFLTTYRKSFFGLSWLALAPLLGILSWIVMNKAGILQPGATVIPYPAYVLIGITFWGLFMGAYTGTAATLTTAQSYIFQVNYPHEILPVKQMMEQAVSFLITYIINVIILLCCGIHLSWGLLAAPFLALPLLLLGAAIGLIVSVIGIAVFEIKRAVETVLGFLLFLTPVLFAPPEPGTLIGSCIRWNPVGHLIVAARDMLITGALSQPWQYAIAAGIALISFFIAMRMFSISESIIIEKMI